MEGVFFIGFIIFAAVAAAASRSTKLKGYLGEFLVHRTLEKSLPRSHYTILRDVTLKTRAGTTQIDHIVVSPYGLFVIETKHMSGWIFGSEHDTQWTQSFRRSKRRFQNPLRQNHGHIKALQEMLHLDFSKFYSVVVFTGSAVFKKPMPVQVTKLGGLLLFIQVRTSPLIDYDEAVRLAAVLESRRLAPGRETNAAHLESLRARHPSAAGAIDDAGGLMRQTTRTMRSAKMTVGLVLIGIFMLIGSIVLKNVSGALSDHTIASSRPPVQHSPFVKKTTPAVAPSAVRPVRKTALFANTRTYLEKVRLEQAALKQQRKIDEYFAWEASLMCVYSSDTRRCVCYEPNGGKVKIEFNACKALVEKGSASAR